MIGYVIHSEKISFQLKVNSIELKAFVDRIVKPPNKAQAPTSMKTCRCPTFRGLKLTSTIIPAAYSDASMMKAR